MSEVDPNLLKQLISQGGDKPKLAAAFVAAWGEIGAGVEKNATNPHFNNDYADLSAVVAKCKPVLARNKLALIQAPGELEGDKVTIINFLVHESGESFMVKTQLPLGGKSTAQAAGSAITYARRYAFMAIFGLAPVDDDGEAASAPVATKAPAKKKEPTYAEGAAALLSTIAAFAGTVDVLESEIRPLVEDLGDAEVDKAYVVKKRELKGKNAGIK